MAVWVFRVEPRVCLCHGFSGSNPASGSAMGFQVPNVILSFGPALNVTLWFALFGHLSWARYLI